MSKHLVTLALGTGEEEEPEPAADVRSLLPELTLVDRPRRRRGILASSALHLLIVATFVRLAPTVLAPVDRAPNPPAEPPNPVFLPSNTAVRQMLGLPKLPPRPARLPADSAKDRISIGSPAPPRKEPLILHRDDDLTAVAKGSPQGRNGLLEAPAPPRPMAAEEAASRKARLPVFATPGGSGPLVAPGPITASLRRFEAAVGAGGGGPFGAPTGTGGQMGALSFDPLGADFTAWMQRFKSEVYRNWIVPQAAIFGMGGEVDFEFTVDRSGAMTSVSLLQSSGTAACDRAARNALLGSRFAELPADYGPATVTMRVGFLYPTGAAPPQRASHTGR